MMRINKDRGKLEKSTKSFIEKRQASLYYDKHVAAYTFNGKRNFGYSIK